jgi:hypothetical protein
MTDRGVDPACYDLAKHFLSGDPPGGKYPMNLEEEKRRTDDLAQAIQRAVEDWYCLNETK